MPRGITEIREPRQRWKSDKWGGDKDAFCGGGNFAKNSELLGRFLENPSRLARNVETFTQLLICGAINFYLKSVRCVLVTILEKKLLQGLNCGELA